MVPSPPDRLFVNYDGDTKIDDNQQRFKMYQPGAHADHWPFREDNTLIIEQVNLSQGLKIFILCDILVQIKISSVLDHLTLTSG